MLERGILERSQHSIHPRLITRPLGLKPLKDISIDAERHRCFGWYCFEASADDPAHDMLDLSFGMLLSKFDLVVFHAFDTNPISLRGFRRG